jgi:hypothetical protein
MSAAKSEPRVELSYNIFQKHGCKDTAFLNTIQKVSLVTNGLFLFCVVKKTMQNPSRLFLKDVIMILTCTFMQGTCHVPL